MASLLPIGTFSEMTRLSVKALRRYADSGLLVPAEVDPQTGYRYYALDQAPRADTIRTLRSLDMGLDDIAALLDADQDKVHELLAEHRVRLEAAAARHAAMIGQIDRIIGGKETLMGYTVTVEEIPEVQVLSLRQHATMSTILSVYQSSFTALGEAAATAEAALCGAPFVVFHDVIDDDTDGDIEFCFPIAAPPGSAAVIDPVAVRTLAGGPVASALHTGPYEQLAPTYHAIVAWAHEHGHQLAGPPREHYLNDPTSVDPADLETLVQWPITEAEVS